MDLLLHICCAPCSTYSVESFKKCAYKVRGFFFNPNIHPYREFKKRKETLAAYARETNLEVIFDDRYLLEDFLRQVVNREEDRCRYCYAMRLREAARVAKEHKIENFSTTLLISPYQKHDLIREIGERIGREEGVDFIYQDLRKGYRESVKMSRELGLYRQPYCGCIYSEKERYYKENR